MRTEKELVMKKLLALLCFSLISTAGRAEYRHIDMTVFGMDCAPCAHAVHVSVKGIQGVDAVDVDLNSGRVAIKLNPGNKAGIRQVEEAIEKNGFTHKDAAVVALGRITGPPTALVLEVVGTPDRYALAPAAQPQDLSALIGKTVEVTGVLPQIAKGKVPETLRYTKIAEAN